MHYKSRRAQIINFLLNIAVPLNRKKFEESTRSTRDQLITTILQAIQELEDVLSRPTVRGHEIAIDRRLVVDEDSSINCIFRPLIRYIDLACKLADSIHSGPAANEDELDTLKQVDRVMSQLAEYPFSTITRAEVSNPNFVCNTPNVFLCEK